MRRSIWVLGMGCVSFFIGWVIIDLVIGGMLALYGIRQLKDS